MHTFGETGAGVPAFLAKLWRLVEDPETNNLIYWSRDGRSFIIQNQAQFARELLPLNYKHNNMASFIRQLNMYGFHKITSIDNGGLKFDRDEMEFSHPYFKRGCPYLLEHIKRKIANTKTTIDERAGMKPEAVSKVLNEVKVMRGRQDSLDSRFSVMKQENEALWREIASLRQKHMKQQQIVNKLIQFLVTIVQPSRNMSGVKRHFQLMINDAPQSSKLRKRSESESGGPVIHELPEELLDEVADSDAELLISGSPNVLSPADASNHGGSEIHDEPSPKSVITSDRPSSTHSISSHYDSNLSEDTVMPPENKQTINNSALNSNNYEPEQVVFHISEVPDQELDSTSFMDENILNTPMVKQELAKSQDRQIRGRKRKHQEQVMQNPEPIVEYPQSIASVQPRSTEKGSNSSLRIKVENEVDPLMFLDVPENSENSNLLSPNGNSNSSQRDKQLYTSDGFINADMPSDLFEESPMIGDINLASGSYNENLNLEEISREAAEADGAPQAAVASTSADASSFDKNQKNSLTLAKYPIDDDIMRLSTTQEFTNHLETVQDDLDNLKDILRGDGYSLDSSTLLGNATTPANRIILSSPLDGDILAKLFSDSDILAPYGLSLTGDAALQNSKKGSEVVSYQPYLTTDFSDLLDMNSPESIGKTPDYNDKSTKGIPCSTLNTPLSTPYPERE